jgi:AcrR family transcriptional regulator
VDGIEVERRAPFGDNPAVGPRGARTQRRIVLAALEVFGEVGYHACRVEAITGAAGCSRPTFYQYFSNKEDVFRQLAGVVARERFRAADGMGPVTPDADGWRHLRAWLEDSASIYETYQPVFATFAAAAGTDDLVASGAARVATRMTRILERKIDPLAFAAVGPTELPGLLSNSVHRTVHHRQFLLGIAPDLAPEREPALDALADVLHRTLFGRRGGRADARRAAPSRQRIPRLPLPASPTTSTLGRAGAATQAKLLEGATATFAAIGYHDARVDDIVAAAGTSHGTFYRYFENKEAAFRAVAGRSGRRLFELLTRIPDVSAAPGSAASARRLSTWIADYATTWHAEGPIIRLWLGAMGEDDRLGAATARGLDVVIRALTGFLDHRSFGDPQVDALLLFSILDLEPSGAEASGADREHLLLQVIRRGFLGIDGRESAR